MIQRIQNATYAVTSCIVLSFTQYMYIISNHIKGRKHVSTKEYKIKKVIVTFNFIILTFYLANLEK